MGADTRRSPPRDGPASIAPTPSRSCYKYGMRRLALTLGLLALVACGERASVQPGQLRPQDLSRHERQAFVYAAAIRHLVSQMPSEPRRIFVLDRAVGSSGEPVPIPIDVQDRVREELALLPRLTFVSDRGEVIGPAARGARVRNEGVLITLGPVPSGRDQVRVRASRYEGSLGSTSQTLELRRYGLRWQVEGTTGAVATS
jgi:hypothetical protein